MSLKSLVLFQNLLYSELIRSVHVYRFDKGDEEEVMEKEFVFSKMSDYTEITPFRVFTLDRFDVCKQFEGLVNGVWICVYVFDFDKDCAVSDFRRIPLLFGNPKLEKIPALANDLNKISKMISRAKEKEPMLTFSDNASELTCDSKSKAGSTRYVIDLDLNSIPQTESDCEESKSATVDYFQLSEICEETNEILTDAPGEKFADSGEKRNRRTATKRVANLGLSDLSKYFDVPIVVAAKRLNVGLTVLKKKCRKFGIPRWPHRKIKSLDSLLRNLQDEVEKYKEDDEETREMVEIKRKIIESEKQKIEKRPFMDIQRETKRFRQNIFKKRHKSRILEIQSRTLKLF